MAAAISKGNPYIFSLVEPFTCYRSINSRSDISIIGRDVEAEQGQKFEDLKSPQSMSISGACSNGRERKFKNHLLQSFHLESFYSVG